MSCRVTALLLVSSCKSTHSRVCLAGGSLVRLAEAIHVVSDFLIEGLVQPATVRLTRSSILMDAFYKTLHERSNLKA